MDNIPGQPPLAAATKTCWKCSSAIDAQDNYCKYCGAGQGNHVAWYYQQWGIILLIFLIGPFALYSVIKSPVLSKKAKWGYAIAVAVFTFYIGFEIYRLTNFLNTAMENLLNGRIDQLPTF
ncbi:hypothetical protein AAIR98_000243 [Elusimicrobium simillimum]|uniref:hypothetical protein n=1 Tax=Elusimicrobium simillimum TaxID=3143438 RepID=UPI003C70325B